MWLSSADGQQYAADEIPSNVAAIYTAQLYTAPEKVQRIGGQDSADTAAQIAEIAFPDGSEWMVIARDDHFADAMSATGLAGTLDAPIVLTSPHYISAAAADAIMKLGAIHALIVGGTGAITSQLEGQLANLGCEVADRLWGHDSWDTSVACADKIVQLGGNTDEEVIVAMSSNFQDALSISSYAYSHQAPIFLETNEATGRILPKKPRMRLPT